jgi:hypothetical protein
MGEWAVGRGGVGARGAGGRSFVHLRGVSEWR